MIQGTKADGYDVAHKGVLLISYALEFTWIPLPTTACSNVAIWVDGSVDGKLVVGSALDHPWNDCHAYQVLLVAHPAKGNASVCPVIAGRLGHNQMNEKGLVHESNKYKNARPEDIGYGATDFIIGPSIAMACNTPEEATEVHYGNPIPFYYHGLRSWSQRGIRDRLA